MRFYHRNTYFLINLINLIMSQNSTLRQPDADFIAFVLDLYDQVIDRQLDWKLEPDQILSLGNLKRAAVEAYDENKAPSTRNHRTSVAKKEAFGNLKHFLGILINSLEANPNVSDADLADMHLRPRIQPVHKPLPVPTEMPLIQTSQQHDEITIYVTRSEQGQPAHGVQLKPYHGFKLRWKFEDEKDFHYEVTTRVHYTLFFDAEDETRRVSIAVAWVNPRLQEGPWTLPVSMVVG
jgi:hypothetical protein